MDTRDLKALVIDLDGTVYRGTSLISGADEAIDTLCEAYDLYFLTNNSTRSRKEFLRRLRDLGIACAEQQLISSGYAAAKYIRDRYPGSRVYVIGEQGLVAELREQHLTVCEADCDCVLVGLDKAFSYTKLQNALRFILAGAVFIATNTDPFLVTSTGIKPGAGAIVASIETASGTRPIVTGKPSTIMRELILSTVNVKPHEILIVGDNLATDILMGIESGMRTALVLTGASAESDIEAASIRPDSVLASLAELPQAVRSLR
ncbi:MAG TPA: HAD-IIA family hydrolase [Methanomicrobia archaeon]|nr:HAD-IIA family hydrolase [Methanomicrobia archaeon]